MAEEEQSITALQNQSLYPYRHHPFQIFPGQTQMLVVKLKNVIVFKKAPLKVKQQMRESMEDHTESNKFSLSTLLKHFINANNVPQGMRCLTP